MAAPASVIEDVPVARDGVLRAVVVPAVVSSAIMVVFLVCLLRGLAATLPGSSAASRFVDDLPDAYGGVGAAVGVSIMNAVAHRRSLRQVRDRLPAGLSPAQRDEVLSASRSGPMPVDAIVRAEARRLAEQRAATRGKRPGTTAAVFASLAAVCVLAGALWSPWWWGDAALLAAVAALIVWRDRQLRRRLLTLRHEVPLSGPEAGGFRRLLDVEQRPDLVASNLSILELNLRRPWNASTSPPVVRIDGQALAAEWGRNTYLLPAGRVGLRVSAEFLTEYGPASTTLTAGAGERTVLHYSAPALTMLDGRLGPRPQRSPGLRGLTAVGLALAALVVVLVVVDP